MTERDKNILTKEIRGVTWGNIISMAVALFTAMSVGYSHYSTLKDMLISIKSDIKVVNANFNNLQKQVDKHEEYLYSKK